MHSCKPILLSICSVLLLSATSGPKAIAQPVSAKTDLTSLIDAERLHFSGRNIDSAQSTISKMLVDATTVNDVRKSASFMTDEGILHLLNNELATASQMCSTAYELRKKSLPAHSPEIAESLNALALVALHQSDFAAAQHYSESALAIENEDIERNALRCADSYDILARTFLAQSNFASAEAPAVQGWKIRAKILGSSHPATAQSVYTLALYYAQKGDIANAQMMLQDSILYGDSLQKSYALLAQSFLQAGEGDVEQSRKTFTESEKLRKAVLGDQDKNAESYQSLFIKYLWHHEHWIDAIEMRALLIGKNHGAPLDFHGKLLQTSFQHKDIPQKIVFKNLVMVFAVGASALILMALLLFAPQLMYMPNGSGFIDFLKAHRREDLRPQQRKNQRDASGATSETSGGKGTARPNGKLGLQAERTATPQWKPENPDK